MKARLRYVISVENVCFCTEVLSQVEVENVIDLFEFQFLI
jgi:hypothetical protein